MRIKQAVLENVYQHQAVDLTFNGDVVALIGPNGSGKSNFLLSLGEGLTGEYHQDLDRIVTRGKEKGKLMEVIELPGGQTFRVEREFPSGKSKFIMGEEKITKARDVNARILELLGVEKSILQNIVFVGQKEITDILFARAGEKDRLAQKFFGLDKANAIEKSLAALVNTIVFDGSEQLLPDLKTRHSRTQTELAELNKQIAPLGACPTPQELAALGEQITRCSAHKNQMNALDALNQAGRALQVQVDGLKAQYDADAAALNQVPYAQIEASHSLHLVNQQANETIRRIDRVIEMENTALKALGACPHAQTEIDEVVAKVEEHNQHQTRLIQSRAERQGILNSMLTTPTCPTCGQTVDISRREPIEKELAGIEVELKAIDIVRGPLIVKRTQMSKKLSDWNQAFARISGALSRAQTERGQHGTIVSPEPDPAKYQTMKETYNTLAANLRVQAAQLEALQVQLTENTRQRAEYATVAKAPDDYREPAELQKELDEKNQNFHYIQGLISRRLLLEGQLSEISGQLAIATKAALENRVAERYQKAIIALRSTFHPDGAPRTLVTRNTQRMESRINDYLGQMETPFTVVAKEGLNFDCIFPDGKAYDTELSIGQQTSLAWAFRFAACETFSSSVGLMTLDEPTAPMDKKIKGCFNQIVEGLKDLSKKYNMQFFVSTHDDALASFCDQIVKFSPPIES